ncbi:hypothetical protein ACFU3E_07835 [Streptomyces sp. NPDC057424]|uniref:hypothetical protein n=1 Tax=Streptomyces sp. NPDC057424 TaxID=3346127 RepID=UPI00368BF18A
MDLTPTRTAEVPQPFSRAREAAARRAASGTRPFHAPPTSGRPVTDRVARLRRLAARMAFAGVVEVSGADLTRLPG